jgi:ABC-type dipeptide/oligopeptide/nickel transport system permease subunit
MSDGMKSAGQRLWARRDARWSLIVVGIYLAAAIWGECVYRISRQADRTPAYNRVDETHRYLPPAPLRWGRDASAYPGVSAWAYLLGSDNLGRDVLGRVVQGVRIAFHVGIITSLIALPLGVILGCLGGYFGGRTDSVVNWLCATVASMPGQVRVTVDRVAQHVEKAARLGVPAIAWGAGVRRGHVTAALVHAMDWFPTLATFAGMTIKEFILSKTLTPSDSESPQSENTTARLMGSPRNAQRLREAISSKTPKHLIFETTEDLKRALGI